MKQKLDLFFKTTKRILYENKRLVMIIWNASPFWLLYSCLVQIYEGIYPIFNNYTTKLMIDSVTVSLEQKKIHSSVYVSLGLIVLVTVLLHIILAIKNYIDVSCIDKINLKINLKIMKKISEKPYYHFESPEEMDRIDRVRQQGSGKCIEQFNYSCSLIFYDFVFGFSTLFIMLKISYLIIVFDHDITEEEIKKVLYRTDFSKEELEHLPNGLQTFLNREYDEDGTILSEGQWQRVAVVRALCYHTPLIILDEPTSNLDPISEENIYNVINTYKGDHTVIMVSHRLSGAMNADKIIVIDDGMIAGIGTHQELIKNCEIYSRMFQLQANRYLV